MARSLLLLAALLALACSGKAGTGTKGPTTPASCRMPDCQLAAGETCGSCFAQLGRCCYQDETIGGQAAALASSCESRDDCRRCCEECAARSCDAVRAAGDCANLARP